MYEKILVPVDGSPTAKLGVREAVRVARSHHCQIRLVHVVNELAPVRGGVYVGDLKVTLRADGEAALKEAQELIRQEGLDAETVIIGGVGGHAGDFIVEHAKTWAADLIVIGTHGRRGLRRLVMGSDAEYVVRMTPVPVLLVRDQSRDS
jgi:nucleotide-binding universal stress UspA family protein